MAIISAEGIEAPTFKSTAPPVRQVAQIVEVRNSSYVTGGNIPIDNTIPQIVEGTLMLTLSITPKNALSTIAVEIDTMIGTNTGSNWLALALFKDGGVNAVAANAAYQLTAGAGLPVPLTYSFTPGSLTPITLAVRFGCLTGACFTNGNSSSLFFGGVLASGIKATEYLP